MPQTLKRGGGRRRGLGAWVMWVYSLQLRQFLSLLRIILNYTNFQSQISLDYPNDPQTFQTKRFRLVERGQRHPFRIPNNHPKDPRLLTLVLIALPCGQNTWAIPRVCGQSIAHGNLRTGTDISFG